MGREEIYLREPLPREGGEEIYLREFSALKNIRDKLVTDRSLRHGGSEHDLIR